MEYKEILTEKIFFSSTTTTTTTGVPLALGEVNDGSVESSTVDENSDRESGTK